jgi:iron complex outermembrane receptor protein
MDAERLLACEAGYRYQPTENTLLDLAIFYNSYDDLRVAVPSGAALELDHQPPLLAVSYDLDSAMEGETYGVELLFEWQPYPWWRLSTGYSYLDIQLHRPSGADNAEESAEEESPANQATFRSQFDLPGPWELDGMLRFIDRLPAFAVDRYLELDVRLAWRPSANLEVAVIGRSLLDDSHLEFDSLEIDRRTEVERAIFGKLTWRF